MTLLAGIDIGGTKCAVSLGVAAQGHIELLEKISFPTPSDPTEAIKSLTDTLEDMLTKQKKNGLSLSAVGISCGGPLDSQSGLVLSPPNLPGWDKVDIVSPFAKRFAVPVALQNDANACALAEWKWGAGKGCKHMIFLTFGTGMGAGLILDGKLFTGVTGMAGEVGHIRMEDDGPGGYGKLGSFEGFCSGGGIRHLVQMMVLKRLQLGEQPAICPTLEKLPHLTAKKVGEAAQDGDPFALEIFEVVAKQLGRGLALLVDILNPECIVIGSIYGRQRPMLQPLMIETLEKEAHPRSLSVCRIVPALFGEKVGDFASLSVAWHVLLEKQ